MLRQLLERLLAWLFSLWNPPPSSRVSTDVNVSADPLPEVTAGLNLAAGAVKLVAQENAEHNTPGMVNAAIETHAQAAKDAVQRAIAKATSTRCAGWRPSSPCSPSRFSSPRAGPSRPRS